MARDNRCHSTPAHNHTNCSGVRTHAASPTRGQWQPPRTQPHPLGVHAHHFHARTRPVPERVRTPGTNVLVRLVPHLRQQPAHPHRPNPPTRCFPSRPCHTYCAYDSPYSRQNAAVESPLAWHPTERLRHTSALSAITPLYQERRDHIIPNAENIGETGGRLPSIQHGNHSSPVGTVHRVVEKSVRADPRMTVSRQTTGLGINTHLEPGGSLPIKRSCGVAEYALFDDWVDMARRILPGVGG